ncbi:amino acid ABC transporter permease [Labrys monachus]|uniref:Polar amino acid transport system permease protein n=1 Tax=Labrys monachus TaxID=217067 RepID=A0ABU0FJW4_9HYPH|nr:amino acid ABC transporter permease [Labrys monachus]MDQ0394897.1 polar amino acid transport system permease protein [Labrys monachus]
MNYTFQFGEVLKHSPELMRASLTTLEIAFAAFWGGCLLGIAGAMGKVYGNKAVVLVVRIYVGFFTNTPSLIQIFVLFYALPDYGIMMSPLTASIIGLTLNAGAYLTEIMRAGVISVRRNEMEAAEALGMSGLQSFWYVILPHIARTIYAPLSNMFIWLVLGSSIAGLFGVSELTGTAIDIGASTFRTIEVFLIAGGIYVMLTVVASVTLYLVGLWCFRVRARIF